jgi:hypothetical protein
MKNAAVATASLLNVNCIRISDCKSRRKDE